MQEGYELAQKELKEKAKEKIKAIVLDYLERIEKLDNQIDELQDEKKQLKLTLDDIKSGKLEVLKERLEKDPKAKRVNVIEIHETHIHNHNHSPWYQPYVITYPSANVIPLPITTIQCDNNSYMELCLSKGSSAGGVVSNASFSVNASDCKSYSVGTYQVGSNAVNFR